MIVVVVLAVLVWATRSLGAVGLDDATLAGGSDAPGTSPELRSRGPPRARCDSPGRRSQFPFCPCRSAVLRSAAVPTMCRRPGSTRPILDSSITTDYNNRPIPTPSEGAAG